MTSPHEKKETSSPRQDGEIHDILCEAAEWAQAFGDLEVIKEDALGDLNRIQKEIIILGEAGDFQGKRDLQNESPQVVKAFFNACERKKQALEEFFTWIKAVGGNAAQEERQAEETRVEVLSQDQKPEEGESGNANQCDCAAQGHDQGGLVDRRLQRRNCAGEGESDC